MCAENYQNRDRFDKDIAKIKQGSFFCLTWYNALLCRHMQELHTFKMVQLFGPPCSSYDDAKQRHVYVDILQ